MTDEAHSQEWLSHMEYPRGGSDVWQAKGLRKSDFGCVAIAVLTGKISEVWQTKELGEIGSEGS